MANWKKTEITIEDGRKMEVHYISERYNSIFPMMKEDIWREILKHIEHITEIRIRHIDKEDSKLKAVAQITIDECFVVHDIKIVQGPESLFISMPSRKTPEGEFKDIVHPINTETRNKISSAIFEAYEQALKEEA